MDQNAHIVVIRGTLVRLVLNCMATPIGGLLLKIKDNAIRPIMDIHTKEILGRGTKIGGLYYVDDFSPSVANSVTHPFDSKQKQIWLWHRRLGHPSFSYMKHLILDLFSGFKDFDFTCDTCILAKSHHVPYSLSTNKCTTPFTLIHSDVRGPYPITAPFGVR
ncbi:unnamed protein product [Prunus armeniaca]